MGLLSKLMFWRKEPELPPDIGGDLGGPDLGLPKDEDLGLPKPAGMPGEEPSPAEAFAAPSLEEAPSGPEPLHPGYRPPPPAVAAAPEAAFGSKDIEIISLKLDSLKTTLEAINERIARLEKMAEGGRESPRF